MEKGDLITEIKQNLSKALQLIVQLSIQQGVLVCMQEKFMRKGPLALLAPAFYIAYSSETTGLV